MKNASFHSLAGRSWLSVALAGAVAIASSAAVNGAPARTRITPYLQIEQVLSADFNGGDVLTYTGVGGGVNAEIATRRVTATIAYNYQRQIAWNGDIADADSHNGLAAVHVDAVPGLLGFDAGAMATQTHSDPRIPVPGVRTLDDPNTAEVYSVYAGPTLNTRVGALTVGAAYRLGYVHVDDNSLSGGNLPAGAPRIEKYSSSTVHNATASVGMSPGELPIGWTVGGGYVREDMNRFDSKFEAAYVRGDVVYPVSPTLAVTAGVGYETGEGSQQDIQRSPGGVPIVGPGGTLLPDRSAPRLLTYDESGLIWDAGVIWRPSPRTELQARVGRRYGGTTFTGSLEHKINQSYALSASVYDTVSSFGRLLVADLAGVPQAFDIRRSGLGGGGIQGVPGCVYGTDPSTGVCFDDALQSINNFNFRNRGASLQLSGGRGPWGYGVGAGYNNRRYFAPPGGDFVLRGITDHSFSLSAHVDRKLSRTSGFDLATYANWFDSGVAGSDGAFSTGVTGAYYQSVFHDRIQATASAGIYSTQSGPYDSTVGSVLFGLRYSF